MSGSNYIINTDNLFDDVDDDTFLKNSSNPVVRDMEQQRTIFQQKRLDIEEKTLASSNRSIQLLNETEQIGVGTAEELARQRESLEKTNRNLDEINTNLRYSQKHLNGMKSIFGGIKNYFSGSKDMPSPSSKLPKSIAEEDSSITTKKSPTSPMTPEERYNSHPISRLRSDDDNNFQSQQQVQKPSFDQQLDNNLDAIAGSVARLKFLATDLGLEIESSTSLLDELNDKMEIADVKINKQNKDMNKMLGKK